MLETYKSTMKPQASTNALENRRMMKAAMTSGDNPDLSKFAINGNSAPVTLAPTKLETSRS